MSDEADAIDALASVGGLSSEESEAFKQALLADEKAEEALEVLRDSDADEEGIATKKDLALLKAKVSRLSNPTGAQAAQTRYQLVIDELIDRAMANDGKSLITVTAEETRFGPRDGIYEVVGEIEERTALRYVDRLADRYDGLSVREGKSGGWGGGQDVRKALKMDAETFIESHGDEFGYS